MKRILIVKMWALGDILMATPLLRALKKGFPDCEITWLADTAYAGVLQGNPLLVEVIPFDSGKWRKHYRYGQWLAYWRMSQQIRRELRDRRFDIVISLTAEKWWSRWFNVAPINIGLFPRLVPGRMGQHYTIAIPRTRDPWLHNSRHYLLPAEALGIAGPYEERMVLGVPPEDRRAAEQFLEAQPGYERQKPLIVLHPGTSQDTKCWPPAYFARLAALLQPGYQCVVTGSPSERHLADQIVTELPLGANPPFIAAGALPRLLQTAALIEQAAAVVTGDTSVLHMASALDVPLVGIYGSTRPNDNAPLFGRSQLLYDETVPCAPCYKSSCPLRGKDHLRCQRAVTPEQVVRALETLLHPTKVAYESSFSL